MKTLRAFIVVFGCALFALASTSCSKRPSAFDGTWRCQTTLMVEGMLGTKTAQSNEITLELNHTSSGKLTWLTDGRETDAAEGDWAKSGDYLVVERKNGGFAAFKVVAKSDTKMTLVSRLGVMLEFTKVR